MLLEVLLRLFLIIEDYRLTMLREGIPAKERALQPEIAGLALEAAETTELA